MNVSAFNCIYVLVQNYTFLGLLAKIKCWCKIQRANLYLDVPWWITCSSWKVLCVVHVVVLNRCSSVFIQLLKFTVRAQMNGFHDNCKSSLVIKVRLTGARAHTRTHTYTHIYIQPLSKGNCHVWDVFVQISIAYTFIGFLICGAFWQLSVTTKWSLYDLQWLSQFKSIIICALEVKSLTSVCIL